MKEEKKKGSILKTLKRAFILILIAFVIGAIVGYYFGYDVGFEKAARILAK